MPLVLTGFGYSSNRGSTVSTWIRDHRDGVTATVTKTSRRDYVAYATAPDGTVTPLVDDEALDGAQAAADDAAGCPQPCFCPPWLEFARTKGRPSK